jgi:hypothetical protein
MNEIELGMVMLMIESQASKILRDKGIRIRDYLNPGIVVHR